MAAASVAGGRYRLERRLGTGGMAEVYRAHDVELDRPVAVKLLADKLAGDSEVRGRFLREGRLAARLAHPNVVAVYDAGEQDGRPYIVMEHVDGVTLAELVRSRGRLPPQEVVDLVLQVCAGLEHAHAAGLVHRDVKPRNILVAHDGTVKIADFGIARAEGSTQVTGEGTILGTAAYLAPEQATAGETGPAADLYSLGAVLYELLSGRPPYDDASLEDLLLRHREKPSAPPRPPGRQVPPQLEEVVMRTLARLPEYRPPSAAALADELRAAMGEHPTEEREPPTEVLRRRTRPVRRGWAVVLAATAALLALVLALTLGPGAAPDAPAPAPVEPVPQGETPEEHARGLADWLRRRSG